MIGNAKPGFVKIRDTMRGVNSQQDSIAQLRRYRWTPSTMLGPLLFLLACHGALPAILRSSQLKLSRSTMAMSLTAAELSRLVYDSNPSDAGWKQFTFFDDEPDQAIVASQRGVCYVAFRGTTQTWEDWLSNLNLADHQVCDSGRCCTTRLGIWESFAADYQQKLEKKLLRCTRRCKDRDRCVVLTGHSQGGSTAEVAALHLNDYEPYVITFGAPLTIDTGCQLARTDRWYRYINSGISNLFGRVYDPVPFLPGLGASGYGHLILLSEDTSGVAYFGLDSQDSFLPWDLSVDTHRMRAYYERIEALVDGTPRKEYPLDVTGFGGGTVCTKDDECQSDSCTRPSVLSFYRCEDTRRSRRLKHATRTHEESEEGPSQTTNWVSALSLTVFALTTIIVGCIVAQWYRRRRRHLGYEEVSVTLSV